MTSCRKHTSRRTVRSVWLSVASTVTPWGLAEAAELAEETLATVQQVVNTETPHERAHAGLARDISGFAANLLAGGATGISGHR
jgi:hypothetical protein